VLALLDEGKSVFRPLTWNVLFKSDFESTGFQPESASLSPGNCSSLQRAWPTSKPNPIWSDEERRSSALSAAPT
jgi:hypothetical protein